MQLAASEAYCGAPSAAEAQVVVRVRVRVGVRVGVRVRVRVRVRVSPRAEAPIRKEYGHSDRGSTYTHRVSRLLTMACLLTLAACAPRLAFWLLSHGACAVSHILCSAL